MTNTPCTHGNCNQPARTLNLCERHYQQDLRARRRQAQAADPEAYAAHRAHLDAQEATRRKLRGSEYKFCPSCERVRLRSEFGACATTADRLQTYCRACRNAAQRERYRAQQRARGPEKLDQDQDQDQDQQEQAQEQDPREQAADAA